MNDPGTFAAIALSTIAAVGLTAIWLARRDRRRAEDHMPRAIARRGGTR